MAEDITLMGATYSAVPAVTLPKAAGGTATFYDADSIDYAASPESGGNAVRTNGVLFGRVDSTSTSTVFTATVDGLTELYDGVCIMLDNGVVTSAANFTLNVNSLGALPVYYNLNDTRQSTMFNLAYTLMFYYDSEKISGGCWVIYGGYDSNTNTIAYQVRTNSSWLVASDTGYRYRLWLTSADGTKLVPINTSTSTNATTARTLNTRAIDPFGAIVYNSTNGTVTSGAALPKATIWTQYTLSIGYSYVLTMTYPAPVYIKCTPQSDGSAVMQTITQALPSTKDGYIYIFLGWAYSTTSIELRQEHPVYWHDGTGIRLWTGAEPSSGGSTVSVTQVVSSGTKIATVTVNGTGTDLYAPSGSSLPTVTSADNGKVLRVVSGVWAAAELPSASGVSF